MPIGGAQCESAGLVGNLPGATWAYGICGKKLGFQ